MKYEPPERVVFMKIKLESAHKSNLLFWFFFFFTKEGKETAFYVGVAEWSVKD